MSAAQVQTIKLFVNGNILTLDHEHPKVEAMIVAYGRIIDIGSTNHVLRLRTPGCEVIDLRGATVLPGFNDSHMHLLNWGLEMDGLDLACAESVDELVSLGRRFAQQHPERGWILGRGWNDENFEKKQLPTATILDHVCSDRPLMFTRVCGHVCAVNSAALYIAGIGADTPDPAGGHIDKDPYTGLPTGILRETAMDLVLKHIPEPTLDDLKRAIRTAAHAAAALGLTSVQTNDIMGSPSMQRCLEAYRQLYAEGELPIRINLQVGLPTREELDLYLSIRHRYEMPGDMFRLGPLKLFADGSLGARTAALNQPYCDEPDNQGITIYTQAELNDMVQAAVQADMQVAVHAIGDRAIDMVLQSYEQAISVNRVMKYRPRIIHAQITSKRNLQRMADLGVVADIQPVFVPTDMHFAEQRIGAERSASSYAWKTMLKLRIPIAIGSDCPVESCSPLENIYAAITRQDRSGFPQSGWNSSEKLTPMEAITAYTLGSAYACHEEHIKGSLVPGKLADFVVLPDDPSQVSPRSLLSMPVLATYVGGRRVFELS